ncbi:rod shape-determining protein MreC [Desulfonema ishimotonii]|uniref:Cell shape-determining protein MreC n=1 Tax=Desulfonema ishimotonii TaxID=45657 RepID=A0A401G4B1_9BACT|nr:rod shape-determining protein MreC [Desulfonema ishimotonii]GBC64072.1 rod shape-determining protein MreC [Desulfonema ishimotonii]
MFSKRTVLIAVSIIFLAANVVILVFSFSNQRPYTVSDYGTGRIAIPVAGPFQEMASQAIRFIKKTWYHYFSLVSVAHENDRLLLDLGRARKENNRIGELELSNSRLRNLLNFKQDMDFKVVAAEVIGKDPSPWFKSLMINKGDADGLRKGLPVVMPEGVVGVITSTAGHYSKVLLIIDQNSAVDALVQRTRARGVIKGGGVTGQCSFHYLLRRHDVEVGDTVVSSGLDGVFPKGLPVGHISKVNQHIPGIFKEVTVSPHTNFETLEEVLVILDPPSHGFHQSEE